jgi:hypothetical protein
VIDQGGVTGFGTESLQKARIAEILILQDLDGNLAPNDGVRGLPNFAHAADGNAGI